MANRTTSVSDDVEAAKTLSSLGTPSPWTPDSYLSHGNDHLISQAATTANTTGLYISPTQQQQYVQPSFQGHQFSLSVQQHLQHIQQFLPSTSHISRVDQHCVEVTKQLAIQSNSDLKGSE